MIALTLAALCLVAAVLLVAVPLAGMMDRRNHAAFLASIDTLTPDQKAALKAKAASYVP